MFPTEKASSPKGHQPGAVDQECPHAQLLYSDDPLEEKGPGGSGISFPEAWGGAEVFGAGEVDGSSLGKFRLLPSTVDGNLERRRCSKTRTQWSRKA